MKKPWKEVRKCEVYDHRPNLMTESMGGSTILRKLLTPSNGNKTIAAFTAFLKEKEK